MAYYKRRQSRREQATEKPKSTFQQAFAMVADHAGFTRIFMALIIINTIAMAMEHDGMSEVLQDRLTSLNTILTYAFAFEVAVKVQRHQTSCANLHVPNVTMLPRTLGQ